MGNRSMYWRHALGAALGGTLTIAATTVIAGPTATAGTIASTGTMASTATTATAGTTASTTAGPAPAETAAPELQEIVVTGSLIKRINAETAEAITIMKVDTLKAQGITNVEQVMNTLSSNNASVNVASSVGSFSGGGSYANLRGLGNGRTLVLLDGERLAPNAFSGLGVDVNGIPISALDTVEVLREGASAEYGSDAIAGVINFKTKQNYQGGEVQVNFDHPEQAGGGSGAADFVFGHGDLANDGYNFMVTGNYSRQDELRATQRQFSSTGFDPAQGINLTNFPGNFPGNVQDSNGNLYQAGYPACAGNPLLTKYFGDCSYRFSAATDDIPESHVFSGLAQFTKTLPGNNQVKVQYFWTQSSVNAYSGPEFYDFQISPSNPFLPAASQLACNRGPANCNNLPPNLTGFNNVPGANFGTASPIRAIWTDPNNSRFGGNVNTAQRVVVTFSGSNGGWDYAADVNYSKNTNDDRNTGGVPNEAVLAPGGVLSNLINPFGAQPAAGQALINSAYINGVYETGEDQLYSVDAHASHPLGDAFNSGTPASFAFGVNASGERFENATTPYNDLVQAATGLGDSAVSASRQIQAAYVELDAPITKALDVDISDRQDRYSDFGTTNNAKLKITYQAASFLTFRGSASTGFRAPTLAQEFDPPQLAASSGASIGTGNPFCQPGHFTTEFTPTVCASQGLGLFGGNRDLTPETSQNFDLGFVLQPIQDMGITVDYYKVLLKNTIGAIPASAIYGNPTQFASSIHTNSSGTLTPSIASAAQCTPYTLPTCGYIDLNNANTGRITTDGIDLSVQYSQHTAIGTFTEDLEGTATLQFLQQEFNGGPLLNLLGNVQITNINPAFRWQHYLTVNWTSPQKMWGAGLADRFYSGYVDEFPDLSGNLRNVSSYQLVDGFVSMQPISPLTVVFGIRNLFNQSPPFTNATPANFSGGYNALIADPVLRNFYVNLKYKFL
jgi:iron complex outermembrane recepter protein